MKTKEQYVSELLKAVIRLGRSSKTNPVVLDRQLLGVKSVDSYWAPPGWNYKVAALSVLAFLGYIKDHRNSPKERPVYTISKAQLKRLEKDFKIKT